MVIGKIVEGVNMRRRLVIEEMDNAGFRFEIQQLQATAQGMAIASAVDGVKERPSDMLEEVKHFLGVQK